MSQAFTEDGKVIPVTVLRAEPCKVSALRTEEKDGYKAVQIESGKTKREFRVTESEHQVGQEIKVSDFESGEVVDVQGVTKGRGFAGVMKRHGFHGFPASHGHDHPRSVGSIGQMFPQHVMKGLRMAGHMGNDTVTMKNSVVVAVDEKQGLIFVKGGVPGAPNGLVKVSTTGEKKEIGKLISFEPEQKQETEIKNQSENPGEQQEVKSEEKVDVESKSTAEPEGKDMKKE